VGAIPGFAWTFCDLVEPTGAGAEGVAYTTALIASAPALANIRDTVAGWTLNSLAASAAVFVPFDTIKTISSC